MSIQKNIVGIDLFCGAGGMSLGAKQAGIDIIFAVEKCPIAAATYKLNFPRVPMFVGDIKAVKSLPNYKKSAQKVLFGGPPCQGFSTSNQRTRNLLNNGNWMYKEFVRLAKNWNPDWIVLENVKGIRETSGGVFFDAIRRELESIGYSISTGILNAAKFGVPQRRERAFIVGSRAGEPYIFPPENNCKAPTVSCAVSDLPSLQSGASVDILPYRSNETSSYAQSLRNSSALVSGNLVTRNASYVIDRYLYVPPGGNWEDIPPHLLSNYSNIANCHTGIYRRLSSKKPSVVIGNFRKNMLIHPTENRGLSIREAARLQSVPDYFRFSGSIGFQQQQVGNMVPPKLAQAVMRRICER